MKATIIAYDTSKNIVLEHLFGGIECKSVGNKVYIFYDSKENLNLDIASLYEAPFSAEVIYNWPDNFVYL